MRCDATHTGLVNDDDGVVRAGRFGAQDVVQDMVRSRSKREGIEEGAGRERIGVRNC